MCPNIVQLKNFLEQHLTTVISNIDFCNIAWKCFIIYWYMNVYRRNFLRNLLFYFRTTLTKLYKHIEFLFVFFNFLKKIKQYILLSFILKENCDKYIRLRILFAGIITKIIFQN